MRKEVARNFNSQLPSENTTISSPLRGRIKVGVIPSSPRRRLYEPEATRRGEKDFLEGD